MSKFWLTTILKSSQKIQTISVAILFLAGLIPIGTNQVFAQTVLSCNLASKGQEIINTAIADYQELDNANSNRNIVSYTVSLNSVAGQDNQLIEITIQAVEDEAGKLVSSLGIVVSGLIDLFQKQGLNAEESNAASLTTIATRAALPADSSTTEVATAIKQKSIEAIASEQQEIIAQIPDSELLTTLAGLQESSLKVLGLSDQEIKTASQTKITPQADGSFLVQIQDATKTAADSITRPEAKAIINEAQAQTELEL